MGYWNTRNLRFSLGAAGVVLLAISGGIELLKLVIPGFETAVEALRKPSRQIVQTATELVKGPPAQQSLRVLGSQPVNGGIIVDAKRMWTNTGITLRTGDEVIIEAAGTVNSCLNPSDGAYKWVGPNGWGFQPPFITLLSAGPGSSFMSLIGRVGNHGEPFFVGAHRRFITASAGTLYLGVNDTIRDRSGSPVSGDDHPFWRDNAGAFAVKVQVRAPVKSYTITVDPSHPKWTDTGVSVRAGDTVFFEASGKIVWDPRLSPVGPAGSSSRPIELFRPSDFPLLNAPCGSLIGRIGSEIFLVGSSGQTQARADDQLYLSINDRWNDRDFADNRGAFTVRVQVNQAFGP